MVHADYGQEQQTASRLNDVAEELGLHEKIMHQSPSTFRYGWEKAKVLMALQLSTLRMESVILLIDPLSPSLMTVATRLRL